MATIYCSQKLSTLLGLPKKHKDGTFAEAGSHCWNAMLFYLNKRKCLLFKHKSTLYSFLAFDIVKHDLSDFTNFFRQHLTDQLNRTPMKAIGYAFPVEKMKEFSENFSFDLKK